jgi:GDP-L-fucose synthase
MIAPKPTIMKKVLMTGASGFLGKHLVKTLSNNNVEVVALDSKTADLTDCHSLDRISGKDFDHIFHLAAWTQAGTFCDTHRGIQWIVNQQINTNVLNWWQKNAAQAKMITFGTSVSYAVEHDLSEDKYMNGQPYDKFYAYAMCKRMLLVGLQCLQRQYGMNYLYVIPSTLYGPGYHMDGRQMHFIYDLIRKILRGKMYGEQVTLWGDGEQRRELVYVADFATNLLALNNAAENDIFNVGSGGDHSIKEFAQIICELVGFDPSDIQYDLDGYVGAKSKILDVEKLGAKLGNNLKRTDLRTGISETINWFLDNKEILLSK